MKRTMTVVIDLNGNPCAREHLTINGTERVYSWTMRQTRDAIWEGRGCGCGKCANCEVVALIDRV